MLPGQNFHRHILRHPRHSISWVRFLAACFGFSQGVIVAPRSDDRQKRPNVSSLMYPMVCRAQYRRVILDAAVDTGLRDVCFDSAQRDAIACLAMGPDNDPVHCLVPSVPNYSPSTIAPLITSLTARAILRRVPPVTQRLWGGEFWAKGDGISPVGRHGNAAVMRPYVWQQGPETGSTPLHRQDVQRGWFSGAHPPPGSPRHTGGPRLSANGGLIPRSLLRGDSLHYQAYLCWKKTGATRHFVWSHRRSFPALPAAILAYPPQCGA